ncbi:MAG: type II toxin-antitoxin system ParD family antitoxin [Planctomycetota bacterium]
MPNRETRTLSFTPEQSAFLANCVESGRYQSVSEVVRAALRLLETEEAERLAERERVRRLIQEGADQLDRGEVVDAEDVFGALADKHARLGRDAPPA